jgi:PAS domain S-box-containing protein
MASEPVAPHAAGPVAPPGGRRAWLAAILAVAVLGIVGLSWHRYVTLERELAARDVLLHQVLLDGAMIALFALAAIVLATTVALPRRREAVDRAQQTLAKQAERLQIMHEIDRAIIAAEAPQAIAGAVIRPLRELLGVRERTSALEALNRELDDLYNNAPCGYHSVAENGLFVRMNDTELKWLGYSRDEVIGKMGPADLHTPASLEIFRKRFETFKKAGVAKDVEYEFRRKDGTVLPVVLNATLVRDRDGKFVMSRSTIFDNTDRKRAAEQLDALNKELESFSYSVSHDLRSPLRAIDGFSRIVLEDYAGRLDAEGRRLLGVIRDNSRKMGQLIDDLLEYSRLGRKPLASADIDMKRLVEEVLGELPASGGSAPRLALGELPPARGDATLLKRVWANLLGNAVKFSAKREQPVIEVSGRENGAQYMYCVKDNGAGFDMRYYGKLFNVFQRLHREDEFEGTGVGLAIVQRVISRHGGRVWAEGQVDAGAAFYFSLPKEGPDGQI